MKQLDEEEFYQMLNSSEHPLFLTGNDQFNFSSFDSADLDSSNYAIPERPSSSLRSFVATCVIALACLGVLSNTFIVLLSLRCVRGDYRHFIANLALVDIICASLIGCMGYLNLNRIRLPPHLMANIAFAFYGSFGMMICALLPISISRLIAATMHKSYTKFFSGNRSLVFCIVFDGVPLAMLATICFSRMDIAHIFFLIYSVLTVINYIITFVLNILVFRFVANHIKVVQNLFDRSRLFEIRQVAIATLAQAIVPLVCQVPAFISLASNLVFSQSFMSAEVMRLMNIWLAASPFFDSVITIMVIKQYRLWAFNYLCSTCITSWCVKKKQTIVIELSNGVIAEAEYKKKLKHGQPDEEFV